jgi:hypothetical protein
VLALQAASNSEEPLVGASLAKEKSDPLVDRTHRLNREQRSCRYSHKAKFTQDTSPLTHRQFNNLQILLATNFFRSNVGFDIVYIVYA